LEKAPVLKLYVEYVNNYENSVKTISDSTKNKNFVDFVVETVGMVDTYPLSSLLIQPIQRIPRYEMLLTDLVRHTWDAHPDMESLQNALALIKAKPNLSTLKKNDSKIHKNYWIYKPKWESMNYLRPIVPLY